MLQKVLQIASFSIVHMANMQFSVHLTLQGKWHLADGSQTSRNILMRVLSNVNAIYVRAFYGNGGPIPATLRYKFEKAN